MTAAAEQRILKELSSIRRELTVLRKEKVLSDKEYITLDEAHIKFGVSKSLIRKARYSGKIIDFKCTNGGRNFKYSVDELEKLFAVKN